MKTFFIIIVLFKISLSSATASPSVLLRLDQINCINSFDTLQYDLLTHASVLEHMKVAASYSQMLADNNAAITSRIDEMNESEISLSTAKFLAEKLVREMDQAYKNAEKMSNAILFAKGAAKDAGCSEYTAVLELVDQKLARVASKLASASGRSGGMTNAISVDMFKRAYKKVAEDFNSASYNYNAAADYIYSGPLILCPN